MVVDDEDVVVVGAVVDVGVGTIVVDVVAGGTVDGGAVVVVGPGSAGLAPLGAGSLNGTGALAPPRT